MISFTLCAVERDLACVKTFYTPNITQDLMRTAITACTNNIVLTHGIESWNLKDMQFYVDMLSGETRYDCVYVPLNHTSSLITAATFFPDRLFIHNKEKADLICQTLIDARMFSSHIVDTLDGSRFYRGATAPGFGPIDVLSFHNGCKTLFALNTLDSLLLSAKVLTLTPESNAEDVFTSLLNSRIFLVAEWYDGVEAHISLALSNKIHIVSVFPGYVPFNASLRVDDTMITWVKSDLYSKNIVDVVSDKLKDIKMQV